MALFRHIKANGIAMTAPVDMGYDAGGSTSPRMRSMSFLYRSADLGTAGADGVVQVRDRAPQMFASVGVRGSYTAERFEQGMSRIRTWLSENAERVTPTGPPRYLGYNSPFVPPFLRYGEVQIPIVARR